MAVDKKYDVVALGELNVDIILNSIDGFPEVGKEKFAGSMTLTLGSSTAIFAANVASLGSRTAFAGMVGRDSFGDLVRKSLEDRGVSTEYLVESDSHATGATVVMSYGEDRANITYQGVMDIMSFTDLNPELFKETRHIHISSVFMQSSLMKDLVKILETAQRAGVTVSMDTQWDPYEKWDFDYKSVLPHVDVFMPNEVELKNITGKDSLEEAVGTVVPFLKDMLVVKCGSRGSLLVMKDGICNTMPAFINEDVVDAIGAGDSFNSGFVHGYVKGLSAVECQRLGNVTGAVNTTAAGGTGAFVSKEAVMRTAKDRFGVEIGL